MDAKGQAWALIASFASYWSQNGLARFVPPFLLHLEMICQRCGGQFACCRLQHSMLWDGKKQVGWGLEVRRRPSVAQGTLPTAANVIWRRSSLVTLYSVHQLLSEEGRFEALALRVWKMFGPSAGFLKATSTKCQFFMPLFGKQIAQWERTHSTTGVVSWKKIKHFVFAWWRVGCVILRKGRQCKSCSGAEAGSKGFAWAGVGRWWACFLFA